VPVLDVGENQVGIGADALVEWRSVSADSTLSLTTTGSWRLYQSDGTPLATGSGLDVVPAPAGSLLAVFGEPGSVTRVHVA